ncbi:DDE-type integrase/transposase/recombinase [Haematospirillum sp. H4485]|nr:DDE-type integrase/transposase/recombinase [Haematospirillum sp. H4890]NKD75501.1 DDE-type integrase/transposase/recombinase [Haematospirillum sp. H4485]
MRRFALLRPHLIEGAPLRATACAAGLPIRTAQRWTTRYRRFGLAGLIRARRADAGQRKTHAEIVEAVETLALQKPRLSAAAIHRRVSAQAKAANYSPPSYAAVHAILCSLDPGLLTLAHEGAAAYRDRFELIHRHQAEEPNAVWQVDHTQLDILALDANGANVRPWLTVVLDDHSRAVAGYTVFLGSPSAIQTALALRQAIWCKTRLNWPVCGIPEMLYVDHGSDFTSQHLEQVAADLRIDIVFSTAGRPQGRGKIERFFGTLNTELLPELPGALCDGQPATLPRLTLADLDETIGTFVTGTYNNRLHGEIGATPNDAWRAQGWLPRMPDSLEKLDLLLLTVAHSRLVRRDGIHFQGLRYTDPILAAYVGETVTVRYDPRDITEVRVFHHNRFLCRAVSPDHAHRTISLKDIQQARIARRKALRGQIDARRGKITDFISDDLPPPASSPARPVRKLALYKEDKAP